MSAISVLILFLLGISVMMIPKYVIYQRHSRSLYKQQTGNTFLKTVRDKGLNGEYLTVNILEKLPGYHKILVNVYLPKEKGGTTEIDVLLLHEKGIYVFESKNYSGWIFGHEADHNWTQTFPNGKKQPFYNPIKQNRGHIQALAHLIKRAPKAFMTSIIVFSERCELKKITVTSPNVLVVKRNHLKRQLQKKLKRAKPVLTNAQIDSLYKTLKPYTQITTEKKLLHIKQIHKMKQRG